MKAGFKFPETLTLAEIAAFRNYEEKVKPIMEEYRRKVDELNANYDAALDGYGDEYDRKLEELSKLHDAERLGRLTDEPVDTPSAGEPK